MTLSRITIVAIEDLGEALLLRLMLEQLGLHVCLNRCGKPSDFFDAFSFYGQRPDAAIVSAHGDDKGICFPEMAPGVDSLVLPRNHLTSEILAGNLHQQVPLIISLACASGAPDIAKSFLQCSTKKYVAPANYPKATEASLFAHVLFHHLVAVPQLDDAVQQANDMISDASQFSLFSS